MSKNKYLHEDLRDFRIAVEQIEQAVVVAVKLQVIWLTEQLWRLYNWLEERKWTWR